MSWPYFDPETGLVVSLKQPYEQQIIPVSFDACLRDYPLVTVNSVSFVAQGLVIGAIPIYEAATAVLVRDGAGVDLTVASGTNDENYKVTVIATDEGGEIHEVDGMIYCRDH